MSGRDLSGYYAVLGVNPSATSEEIKRAFRAKARRLSWNSATEATRELRFVEDAFRVLGSPHLRANYDAGSYGPEGDSRPDAQALDPVICANCHWVTAQPRYLIQRHVVSAVIVTWRFVRQGVFCSECGAKSACKASLKTWLLGWWGIPWGPIYSVQAIFSNLFGGEQPPLNNFRILGWQAIYFAQIERLDLARAIAESALRFAQKIPEQERLNDARTSREIRALAQLLASPGIDDRPPEDPWGCRSMAFRVQAGAVLAAAALIVA